jgi:hypothetical protein
MPRIAAIIALALTLMMGVIIGQIRMLGVARRGFVCLAGSRSQRWF